MTGKCIICEEELIDINWNNHTSYWCSNRSCDVGDPKKYRIMCDGLFSLKRPRALSAKGWDNWDKMAKEQRPIIYYLSDTLASRLRHLRYRSVNRPLTWIRHRTYNRYHRIDTGLAPGWNDVTRKMLYVNFNMLKNYIEREKASHMLGDESVVATKKWYQFGPFDNWTDPELGIKHLEWEMTLGLGKSHQALAAKEQFELYIWWTTIRPKRIDPIEASGMGAFYDKREDKLGVTGLFDVMESEGPECEKEWKRLNAICEQLETDCIQEDEDNLIRLMKIRDSLWT